MVPQLPTTTLSRQRRGVTLVEMLVTVAVLVLMMTIIVQIFQAATGAVQGLQVYEQLDSELRQLDQTLRSDLHGVTARMTPPLDPKDNLGYFEYGENAFADLQGEDTDDYIRFTAKAPEGRPFTGRAYLKPNSSLWPNGTSDMTAAQLAYYRKTQPVLLTSDYAEIIYFLRNGNLYRRVFLVAPQLQSALEPQQSAMYNTNGTVSLYLANSSQSISVSWQGMNDLSARPSASGDTPKVPVLNTLGDLTNRENRAFSPRFSNDFDLDGIADDTNQDGIPDYYPNFYCADTTGKSLQPNLIFDAATRNHIGLDLQCFPYLYQWAYSQPDPNSMAYGWIHSPDPAVNPSDSTTGLYNHAPLETGDSIPPPITSTTTNPNDHRQTWWGFPTLVETLSTSWTDPTFMVGPNLAQPLGLQGFTSDTAPANLQSNANRLPLMNSTSTPDRYQLFNDGYGSSSFDLGTSSTRLVPQDDLIMTGVRSFDVKAYDSLYPGYVDLGWGSDPNTNVGYNLTTETSSGGQTFNLSQNYGGQIVFTNQGTYAHEGHMPPLSTDYRYDYQLQTSKDPTIFLPPYSGVTYGADGTNGNLGDDRAAVRRLRRVFDTWSTDYSRAPMSSFDPTTLQPYGPQFGHPPVYPSYPPPYELPLRGLQIQIRVVDPRNQKVKVLTIRHDFTERL